jgi:hypothetical protein
MRVNLLVIEYPTYSIYQSKKKICSEKIIEDIPYVMKHVIKMGY